MVIFALFEVLVLSSGSVAIINQFGLQQAMTTPPQLKRRSPLESTIDQTFRLSRSKQHLQDIVPCFRSSAKESPKQRAKPATREQTAKARFSSTDELQEQISQNIRSDDQKSEFVMRNGARSKVYSDCPARMKIAKGCPWPIPQAVREMYAGEESQQNGRVNFAHGCLPKSAIYYFAVEKRVLFYDLGGAIGLKRKLEECLLQTLQFQSAVFELREIEWCPSMFKQLKNKNILVISSAWALQLAVLEVSQLPLSTQQHTDRWIKITMLNYSFQIASARALCLTQGAQELFYVDQAGRVNKLAIQPNDFWGRIINGKRYKLSSQTAKQSLSKNYFYVTKKSSLMEKIRHYAKVVACELRSMYKASAWVGGLVYDKKRRLLFSLIDSHSQNQSLQGGCVYSYSKLLSCWQVEEGRLRLACQTSEVQLLAGSGNDQILSHNIAKNNKIARIMPVQQSYYPDCCLLVLLNSGVRLYLKIQEAAFQLCAYELPPSFEARQRPSERRSVEYTKSVELLHGSSSGNVNLLTVRQDEVNHTFYVWKEHEGRQCQSVAHLAWKQSLYEGDSGQCPLQSFLFASQLGFTSRKRDVLAHLQQTTAKPSLFCAENAGYNHQLVRDVFQEAPLYVHATDSYIEHFFALRPIDLLFMAVKAEVFDRHLLRNIMGEWERRDLQVLIIQLLCDDEGLYVMDVGLTQCFSSYTQKCLQIGSYASFETHRDQFFREVAHNKAQKIPLKESEPELQRRQDICQRQYEQLCGLLFELCLSQGKQGRSARDLSTQPCFQEINLITGSILCYLSRVLRYIWLLDLTQISSKAIHIVEMLQPLLTLISALFDQNYISKAKHQAMSEYAKTKEKVKRIQGFVPVYAQKPNQSHSDALQRSLQMVQKLKYFINKIIQLVLMSTQTKLDIKRKFHSCLGLQPQFFQQFIFNYLIINYSHPFKILQAFQATFPLFIGKNLEKSLRIYNETKSLSSNEVFKTAKEHQKLPDYLLAYMKSEKGIRSSEIKEIRDKKQETIKVAHSSGSKEMVEQLLKRVNQQYLSCAQRKTLLFLARKELQIYRNDKMMGDDRFYLATARQTAEIEKIIDMQEIILGEYIRSNKNNDNFVVDQLKNGLTSLKHLKEIVETMEDPKLEIVFLYLFNSQETKEKIQELKKHFKTIFERCHALFKKPKSQKPASGISKYFALSKAKQGWKPLEKMLMFVIGKARKYINFKILVQILENSLEASRIANRQSCKKSSQLECLSDLLGYLREKQEQRELSRWINQNDYPIVGLALVKSGVPHEVLTDIYMRQLEEHSCTERSIAFIELKFIMHTWLNLYCLLFQHESFQQRVIDFVDYTKLLLRKMGRSQIEVLAKQHLDNMKQLAKLMLAVSSQHQKISQQYLEELQKCDRLS